MAHTALHFSLGMVIGSSVMLPAVVKAWRGGERVARVTARWLVASYALGIYAVVPSLLGWVGLPAACCGGWWMNAFLLHPLLNRWFTGGMIAAGAQLNLFTTGPGNTFVSLLAPSIKVSANPDAVVRTSRL